MAVTIIDYTGDGTTNQYAITFSYLSEDDVVVTVNEVAAPFTFVNSSTVQITTTPASGDRIVIKRNTSVAALVDFTDGSTLYEADLDLATEQARLLGEEARDRAENALSSVNNNLADILRVRAIEDDVSAVADINTDVETVAGVSADIETLADVSTDIDLLGDYTDEIETVSDDLNAGSFNAGTEYDFGSITEASSGQTGSPDGFIVTVYNNMNDINAVADIASNVTTVSGIASDVTTVATNSANITSVATNIANVNTVAGNNADVSTVAGISADVTAVAADATDIGTVAGIATDIDAVGAITADVTTVAGNTTNVSTVAGISANVTTVAGISADVSTVAGMNSDITAVLADATDIGTVAGDSADIQALGPISADISSVAGVAANVTTVAGIAANTTTVAGISSDVTTVAANNTNVTTVAGISADVTTVAGDSADIQTVADNINSVNDFADKYRIGAADPTADNDTGDLFYNTTSQSLRVYNGSAWEAGVTAGSGFMPLTGGTFTGAVSFISSQTFDGRDLSADGAKLDGIEAGATADQTASEIKTAYESNADTNAFTDAEQTKLAGLEANADVTDAANVEPLIDAHLNYSTATSGQFLKYNGTDYEWGTVDLTPYLALSGGTMTGTLNVPTIDFGDWTITESGGVLYFANGGTNKMKLDASGNLTVTGNVTAYGTV